MAKRDSRSLAEGPFRIRTLMFLVAVGFAVIIVRLFTLQVVQHQQYAQFARDNQLQRQRLPGPRGFMRDRSEHIVVDNALHFEVMLTWRTRADAEEAVRDLATYIPVDTVKAMARFDAWQKRYGRVAFPLFPDADKFMISFVRENWMEFPALRVESRLRRRYPDASIAAHVFGYVGEVSTDEIASGGEDVYVAGDFLGKAGLERQYEDQLRGTPGQRAVEVTASGTALGEIAELSTAPVPGRDVHLALDYHMQAYLDSLLALRTNPAAAVVLDIETGGIIAAASRPAYDPNAFARGLSSSLIGDLLKDPAKPMFNRISQARYAPASTFKIVVAYAILEHQIVDPARVLAYCDGTHRFGNRVFRCWKEEGHGNMNLMSAIVNSCDIYFYRIGEMIDVDLLAEAATAFGFDGKTGIDLPIEVSGNVPTRAYYDKRLGKGRWTQGLMLNNIIGQGEYLATVLHVARMTAAVGNGGWLVQPHFVVSADGLPAPTRARTHIAGMEGATLSFLQRAMLAVVESPEGTAHWTRLPWLEVAGKTGTAQNPHGDHHSWYTAYAPAGKPEIALAILVENAGHGGDVSAPIARNFMAEYFRPGRRAAKHDVSASAPKDSVPTAAVGGAR